VRFVTSALALVALALPGAAFAADPPAILVSRQLAARAHLSVGDVVTLAVDLTGTQARPFRVTGVYEPTPDPMRFTADRLEARLHLPDLVDIVADPSDPESREAVNGINVKLAAAEDARQFAGDLAARAPGVVARQTARPRDDDPFVVLEHFHVAISIVTMIAGTAFLLALMVIRAEERRETIGILRLVGISRRTLLASVAIEGLLVAAIGAAFGILLAYASEDS
jgi:ABC-type lipoprotein release transport system permease subunit